MASVRFSPSLCGPLLEPRHVYCLDQQRRYLREEGGKMVEYCEARHQIDDAIERRSKTWMALIAAMTLPVLWISKCSTLIFMA